MTKFNPKYTRKIVGKGSLNSLTKAQFDQFNVDLLDLGQVSKESEVTNALAAIFDLEGFTIFCSQLDPQLVVPEYLSEFLLWLFRDIVTQFTKEKKGGNVLIWGSLPFFAKFTGDGVLFLWDTELCGGRTGIGNVVISLREICDDYVEQFLPKAKMDYARAPSRLRIGICRGQVLSIGDGNDYVGPCINMASRLQKLGSLSFAASRRGFDPAKCFPLRAKEYVVKTTTIRGIGEDELIVVRKDQFDDLAANEKRLFR